MIHTCPFYRLTSRGPKVLKQQLWIFLAKHSASFWLNEWWIFSEKKPFLSKFWVYSAYNKKFQKLIFQKNVKHKKCCQLNFRMSVFHIIFRLGNFFINKNFPRNMPKKIFFIFLKFWVFSEADCSTPNHAILT